MKLLGYREGSGDHILFFQHFPSRGSHHSNCVLGIEGAQSREGLLMTHQKYILDLLNETKHLQCHTYDTPIEVDHKLTLNEDDPKIEINSYKKLFGKLLYLSHTWLDISYSVNVLSQFM